MPSTLITPESDSAKLSHSKTRRPDVQGLRAIAVILVIAYHAGLNVPGGYIGVDVFFVISGFVITSMLEREWKAQGRLQLSRFYLRRAKRLLPALSLMTTTTVIAIALIAEPFGPPEAAARTAIGATFLVANFVLTFTNHGYFAQPDALSPLLHTWSLSVEEQFYLFFPAFIYFGWRLSKRFATVPWLVVSAAAIVPLALVPQVERLWPLSFGSYGSAYYSPLARAWEFAVGALVALWLADHKHSRKLVAGMMSLAGLLLLVFCAFRFNGLTHYPGASTTMPVAATALLILGGATTTPITDLLATRPMLWLGDRSYSLYLWHWPAIVIAVILWPSNATAMILAAAISFVPASLAYRYVENPLRRRSLNRQQMTRLLAVCVLVPTLVASFVLVGSEHQWWTSDFDTYPGSVHIGIPQGCYVGWPILTQSIRGCDFAKAGETLAPVYLVGDSNAWQFGEGFTGAARLDHHPLIEHSRAACPFFDVRFVNIYTTTWCTGYYSETMQYLESARTGLVVIGEADYYYRDDNIGAETSTGSTVFGERAKLNVLRVGLTETVRALIAHGDRVLLIDPIPNFETNFASGSGGKTTDLIQSCSIVKMIVHDGCSFIHDSLADVTNRESPTWTVVNEVAAATGATTLSLASYLCPHDDCQSVVNSRWIYMDVDHISPYESRRLAPILAKATIRSLRH